MKQLIKPGVGFFSFESAWWTRQGDEAMHMMRKGQIQGVAKDNFPDRESGHPRFCRSRLGRTVHATLQLRPAPQPFAIEREVVWAQERTGAFVLLYGKRHHRAP